MSPEAKDAVKKRLELMWIEYGGNWKAFKTQIELKGTELERAVIAEVPDNFRASLTARKQRVNNWQLNKIKEWLVKLDDLTNATRFDKNVGEVPDNRIRIEALKYLVDKLARDPGPPAGENLTPLPVVSTVHHHLALKERLSDKREQEPPELRARSETA